MTSSTPTQAGDHQAFNQHAHTWWDPNGPMRMLHQLNPLRLGWCEAMVGEFRGKTVLDVGCGGGLMSEAMAAKGANVTGLDLAQDLITIAKLHAEESNLPIEYQLQDVGTYCAANPAKFDVITCLEMLEHVPEPSKIIEAMSLALKPGGTLLISTINRNLRSFAETIIGAEYVLGWLPKGTHHYTDYIRPDEMEQILKAHQLRLKDMSGVKYNFLTESFELCQSAHSLYMMAATHD